MLQPVNLFCEASTNSLRHLPVQLMLIFFDSGGGGYTLGSQYELVRKASCIILSWSLLLGELNATDGDSLITTSSPY